MGTEHFDSKAATWLTLADSSPGMRQVMQDKIEAGLLQDARVWALDLEQ